MTPVQPTTNCTKPNMKSVASGNTSATLSAKIKAAFIHLSHFIGPGYMIAVGYVDPGNFATDLEGGSQFEYKLLFVILLSNIMAVTLQSLCIKLGVVTGRDLASSCRDHLNKYVNFVFYIFCELAIIACDLAEVIGTAVALNLLFGLPLVWGVLITGLDVLIILAGFSPKQHRVYEAIIVVLVAAVAICFLLLVIKSRPDWSRVFLGYIPTTQLVTDPNMLFVAMAVVGAVVMPHNLYLHSHIVMFRSPVIYNHQILASASASANSTTDLTTITSPTDINTPSPPLTPAPTSDTSRPLSSKTHLPIALRYTNIDSMLALTLAFLVNSSILIVAGSAFFKTGRTKVAGLQDAHALLVEYLGRAAGITFAVSLFVSGQSSTFTGTLAGQIIMEGFLGEGWKMRPWLRRLGTRIIAIVPAVVVALMRGTSGVNDLLVLSQVILSLQLPTAIWPLVVFTSSKKIMTVKFRKTPVLQDLDLSAQSDSESMEPKIRIDEIANEERTRIAESTHRRTRSYEHGVSPIAPGNHSSPREARNAGRESLDVTTHWPSPSIRAAPVTAAPRRRSQSSNTIEIEDVGITEQCFANSMTMQVFAYFVALTLSVFNVFLIVQLALGNVTG
ncbi:hypothetical protein SeLEV6574_g07165 [Synchytrium endobioticum]|uniref:Uncharacterized protein n=1 Tax=Synchytrium endobioticum TaxID=286115 RepID=A0A507CEK4_9FUNG|nr:hypothetical protein SeLEV6574_g07165 [Synchytrium endobioticum]